MESLTSEGESPVLIIWRIMSEISSAEHVEFCVKMGGPPSKPKYYLMMDSVQVPWGKGEKNPEMGVK